ncbi:MAG TPA: hypothetical protein VN038_24095 [Dyadobacter sp.]|nr:hypothetical protein [Dyadobacter sp.]
MKSTFLLCLYLVMFGPLLAQTPGGLHYQGVARNAQGAPLAGVTIAVRLNIKDALSNGNSLYSETKSVTTNAFGLYTISINDGSGVRTGDFNAINWSLPRFLQTEIDPANGAAFVNAGTTQMQSVPHAFVSDNLRGVADPKEGEMMEFRNGTWVSKPASKRYNVVGSGYNPGPTYNFIGPIATIVVEKDNPIITINITKALGTNKLHSAVGLNLNLGYKRGNQAVSSFDATGIPQIVAAAQSRVPITLAGSYQTDFLAGETVQIGMVGQAAHTFSDWNDNGGGLGYVEISY